MARISRILGTLALAGALAGCGGPFLAAGAGVQAGGVQAGGVQAQRTGAAWTIAIHMAAAGDLEEFSNLSLNEIEAGLAQNAPINVIVLFDGMKKGSSKLLKMRHDPGGFNDKVISEVLQDQGAVIPPGSDVDSGDPKTLARFSAWAFRQFPAQRHGLVIWNHGSGLFNDDAPTSRRDNKRRSKDSPNIIFPEGFAWSDKSGKHMNTSDVGPILQSATSATGKPLDFLGFDACLMSHIEMAYQTRGLAHAMIASEEIEPGTGWDYNAWMARLSAQPGADGSTAGKFAVEAYQKAFSPGGSHYNKDEDHNTLSAVRYDVVSQRLVPALNRLGDVLTANLPKVKAAIRMARNEALQFDNKDCVDLGSFAAELQAQEVPEDVRSAAAEVAAAQARAAVAVARAGANVQRATGLVVFFPRSKKTYREEYHNPEKIAFAAERWDSFLRAYVKLQ
jgi:hypothetical protein